MVRALVLAAILVTPALARAATATPTPTPPPEQERDPEEIQRELDEEAARFRTQEDRRLAMDRAFRPIAIVPSVGLGGWGGEERHGRELGTHMWFGVLLHPVPRSIGPFMGVGVALDGGVSAQRNDAWYGTIEWRYGIAVYPDDSPNYGEVMFPGISAYAIYGWRHHPETSGIHRVGGGIASPLLMGATSDKFCMPLPSAIEVVVDAPDAKFSSDAAVTSVRVAFQF